MPITNNHHIHTIPSPNGEGQGGVFGVFLRVLTAPLRRNASFFVFMYALGIVAAMCTVVVSSKQKLYENAWLELFLDLYVVAAILAVLPLKVRRWVRGIIYAVIYPLSVVDVYCYVKFDAPINPSILMLIAETDMREAGEFLSSYVSADIIFSKVGWILLIALLHILWSLRNRIPAIKTMKRKKLTTPVHIVFSVAVLSLLVYAGITCAHNKERMHFMFTRSSIGQIEHELTRKGHAEMYVPAYRLAFSAYSHYLTAQQLTKLKETSAKIKIDSCDYTSPEIVWIIGEAYDKHHSQLFGYNKPTTPRQCELEKTGQLIPFDNVVSPWNLTSYVFKHIMSTYTVGDKGDWCDYPLICELFRRSGYHVTFITNEFLYQAKQAVFDFSGGFFLNDPELSKAQFDRRNTKLHIYDDALLAEYQTIKYQRDLAGDTLQKGDLTIFHLIGQHQTYRVRSPKNRKKFTMDDYDDRPDLKLDKWKRNVCDYDNATLFNDSVVREIVRMYENRNAIVIYMPDHGEEVHPQESPKTYGRIHSAAISKRLAKYEFEIPFWIWCSKSYASSHPEIWQQIRTARHRRYMTDAMPHLLMYLAGIKCQYYRDNLNILSPKYDEQRPRILKHQKDYDEIMK